MDERVSVMTNSIWPLHCAVCFWRCRCEPWQQTWYANQQLQAVFSVNHPDILMALSLCLCSHWFRRRKLILSTRHTQTQKQANMHTHIHRGPHQSTKRMRTCIIFQIGCELWNQWGCDANAWLPQTAIVASISFPSGLEKNICKDLWLHRRWVWYWPWRRGLRPTWFSVNGFNLQAIICSAFLYMKMWNFLFQVCRTRKPLSKNRMLFFFAVVVLMCNSDNCDSTQEQHS